MEKSIILSKVQSYLHKTTQSLSEWLNSELPKIREEGWWLLLVEDKLTHSQLTNIKSRNIDTLERLDLTYLVQVIEKNWKDLHFKNGFLFNDKYTFSNLKKVRNRWSHLGSDMVSKKAIRKDLNTIEKVFYLLHEQELVKEIQTFKNAVQNDTELPENTVIEKVNLKTEVMKVALGFTTQPKLRCIKKCL